MFHVPMRAPTARRMKTAPIAAVDAADRRLCDGGDLVAVLEGDQARERRAEQQGDLEGTVRGAHAEQGDRQRQETDQDDDREQRVEEAGRSGPVGQMSRHGGLRAMTVSKEPSEPTSSPRWWSSPRAHPSRPTSRSTAATTMTQRTAAGSWLRRSHSGSRSRGQVMQ